MAPKTHPKIDLVIAVHDQTRPLQRAIDSALESGLETPTELRITVVCHNIDSSVIKAGLSAEAVAGARFLEFADGEPSPAGPFSYGIEQATAAYVSIMGSDDWLEPGALKAWLARAESMKLTVLIPPERHANGAKVTTPPTRPWRRGVLDGVKDRLAYRTAPLGLIRREAVSRLGLTMPPRLRSGSDQLFGAKLWFSEEPVAYGRGCPRYVVGADARTRVTTTVRAAKEELRAVTELAVDPWFLGLALEQRRSVITKITRVHIFSAAASRSAIDSWTAADREYISALLGTFSTSAPQFESVFSIADRRLLDALIEGTESSRSIGDLSRARRRFGQPATVLTRDPRGFFAVDGPLRFMAASLVL